MNKIFPLFSPAYPGAIAEDLSGALERYRYAALQALLLTSNVAAVLISVALFSRNGAEPLTLLAVGTTAIIGLLWWPFRSGHTNTVALCLVFLMMSVATMAVVLDGSVRSASVFVFLAAISIGGAFLTPRSLVATGAFGMAALGALNLMEQHHWLSSKLLPVSWTVWVVQAGVIGVAVISAQFGRNRLMKVVAEQEAALQLARTAEAKLRASDNLFMGVFRNNPAATLVMREATREVIDVNDAFERTFGHTRASLIGKPLPAMWFDPADQLAYRALLMSEGRVKGMHAQGLRKDGSRFEMLVYAEFVSEAEDRMVVSMVLDVSAEVASRRALEQSEERFSKAFNFSPLGMTITRMADGKFVEVNPANERVLGYARSDFLGKTSIEAGVWVIEQDRLDYLLTLKEEGRLEGYETRMRSKAGLVVPVRIWSETIEINGESCSLAFTLNVAEEKRREAMLLNVAEGVSGETGEPFFVSLVDHLSQAIGADGVMVGEVGEGRWLQTLAMVQDGKRQPNVHHDLSYTLCEQALLQREMLMVEQQEPGRMPLVPPFEEAALQSFVGLPLRDADGSPVGLLTAVWRRPLEPNEDLEALLTIFASRCNAELLRVRRDREIRNLQETLERRVTERTEQLVYLNNELDAFAYTVSHDLKSPLRAIDGFMHMLQEQMAGRLTPEDASLVERVEASVARMNSLITDLLSLARVSQGQLQRMDVDLTDLAKGVIRQQRHRDPGREVEVIIAPGMTADCDARLAHIVLENLLGNAWKYSRAQPESRIEFGQSPSTKGEPAQFFIRDNGAGFDMSRSDRLFKPFTRLHSPREFEGTGIGLATVRRIIERHGGQIHANAAVGQGATFWFSFGKSSASN